MATNNPLEVSDEDFMNAPMPEFSDEELASDEQDPEQNEEQDQDEQEDTSALNEPDESEEDETEEDPDQEEEDSTESEDDNEDDSEEGEAEGETDETDESEESDKDEDKDKKEEEETDEEEEKEDKELSDADKQLAKLFTPFKANGKEIKIDTVEDAIQLMQMGANYSKKMAALKPQLKVMKMLENHDLLDESKLSFYIDVEKGKPEAVAKLLKQLNVDPLEVDLDKSEEYKPSTYNVSDNEVEVDSILGEIRDTPTFRRTLDIVSNKWDDSSREIIIQNPELIKVINDHVADGTYDKIMTEMEKDRMLGRLGGLSDIQAYKAIGDKIFQQSQQATPQAEPGKVVGTTKEAKAKDDSKLKSRKKAAGSPKAAPSSKKNDDDFNPLALPDEEFEKLAANKYQ